MLSHHLQNTQGKHEHDHQLLLGLHVQVPQVLQRQNQDHDVDDDVEDSAHPALEMDVVASSLVSLINLVPRVLGWPALEGSRSDKGDSVGGGDAANAVDDPAETLLGENAKDECQDGKLDHSDGGDVEDRSQVIVLCWRQ